MRGTLKQWQREVVTLRKVEKHRPCHETLSVTVLPSPKMPVIETGGVRVGEKQGTVVEEG